MEFPRRPVNIGVPYWHLCCHDRDEIAFAELKLRACYVMTNHDGDSLSQTRARRLRFDRYVLDLDRGSLLLGGNEIGLRPKTFAVLNYLIENCGRLVSKDDLFAAVWPNIAVTDDALVQSIGELRRALGDDGPRLIRTIPRRGYRFESDVTIAEAGDLSPIDVPKSLPHVADDAERPKAAAQVPTTKMWLMAAPLGWRKVSLAVISLATVLGFVWSGIGPTGNLLTGCAMASDPKVRILLSRRNPRLPFCRS